MFNIMQKIELLKFHIQIIIVVTSPSGILIVAFIIDHENLHVNVTLSVLLIQLLFLSHSHPGTYLLWHYTRVQKLPYNI